MAKAPENPILLGVIGGAHGIKGEVRIKSFTEDPRDIKAYGPLFDANPGGFRNFYTQGSTMLVALAAAVGLGLIAGVVPALGASRLRTTDALRRVD